MLLQGKRISRRTLNEVSHLRKNRVQATSSSATAASRLFTVHRTFPKESKRSPRNQAGTFRHRHRHLFNTLIRPTTKLPHSCPHSVPHSCHVLRQSTIIHSSSSSSVHSCALLSVSSPHHSSSEAVRRVRKQLIQLNSTKTHHLLLHPPV